MQLNQIMKKSGDKKAMHDLHDKVHASKVGKALAKFAHLAHEAFVWPIKKILQGYLVKRNSNC